MTLNESAINLSNELRNKLGIFSVTIGSDNISTIYVYEHIRGLKKYRRKEYEGFKVISKYVGKIIPCKNTN